MGAFIPPKGQPSDTPVEPFRSNTVPNVTTFQFQNVAPPSSLYIQRDDLLVVEVADFSGPHTVQVQGRVLLAPLPQSPQPGTPVDPNAPPSSPRSNVIEPFTGTVATLAGGPVSTLLTLPLAEGYLLSVTVVETSQSTAQRGLVFVRAWINRGATRLLS